MQANIVARKGFKTDEQLLNWLLAKNEELCKLPQEAWKPRRRTREKMLVYILYLIYIYGNICVFMYVSIYVLIYIYICVYACVRIYIYICIYV